MITSTNTSWHGSSRSRVENAIRLDIGENLLQPPYLGYLTRTATTNVVHGAAHLIHANE